MIYFGALLAEKTVKIKFRQKLRSATFWLIRQCNFIKKIRKNLLTAP